MAMEGETVWAIDIGSCSLKALHLSTERGVVEVIGFDTIHHGRILSAEGMTGAEREELIALSLRKFVNRHDVSMDEIAVSVPGQNSFARFVNLPPVEHKRIPEIVKFEAVQQIPFDINDVQWDWQLMSDPGSTELKVGLFAIKNEIVNAELEHFNREDIPVGYVQMTPMALYNYAAYDRSDLTGSDKRAVVVLNIGASGADLVVCTKSSVWQRGIMIGGNTFTKAIADTFRLNFDKAEKLKRTAPVSKYARQLFQAMRPVYTDLASEVQQSLGFYSSSNPNTKVTKVIALGGGTKLRGLLKYLQQTLQIPVERPDAFKKLGIGVGIPAAKFHENVCNFGVVYGLALQGLGLANIESNLLPKSVARSMAWAGKGRYFTTAACMLLAVSLLCLGRIGFDSMGYAKNGPERNRTNGILAQVEEIKSKVSEIDQKKAESESIIDAAFAPFMYREVIPRLHEDIFAAMPNEKNNTNQAELYTAFARGDVDTVLKTPRRLREQIFITNIAVFYSTDLEKAKLGGVGMWRKNRSMGGAGAEDMSSYEVSDEAYEEMMRSMAGGGDYDYSYGTQTKTEEKKTGFVVSIAGYSPFGDNRIEFGRIMDPPGVEDKPGEWGFVTRLMHLDDLVEDGNSPFELFGKGMPEHWSFQSGEVGYYEQMPSGIGITEARPRPGSTAGRSGAIGNYDYFILDPMTREVISKIPELDALGKPKIFRDKPIETINDHWFVLNLKFIWRDAPKVEAPPSTSKAGSALGSSLGSSTRSPSSTSSGASGKRKSTPSFDDM